MVVRYKQVHLNKNKMDPATLSAIIFSTASFLYAILNETAHLIPQPYEGVINMILSMFKPVPPPVTPTPPTTNNVDPVIVSSSK